MVIRCCVPGCSIKSNDGFHNFPTNRELRSQWLKKTKTEHLDSENLPRKSFYKVCRNHFHPDDYITYASGMVRLKYETVPTLNLPVEMTLQTGENSASGSKLIPIPSGNSKFTDPEEIQTNHTVGDVNAVGDPVQIEFISQTELNVDIETVSQSRENALKEEIRTLKATLTSTKKKLRYSQQQAVKLRQKLKTNKLSHSNVIEFLNGKFNKEEMEFFKMNLKNAGKTPQGRRYTSEQKSFCLTLYKYSPRTYKHLRKYIILPSKRTLGRHTAQLTFESGINSELFDYLKSKAENMADIDLYCILVWDEMALKAHLDYSPKRDVIDGFVELANIRRPAFATHVLTFMIRGINTQFKQPVAYYYTDGLKSFELAEMVKLVTEAVLCTGLKVIGSASDQVSTNKSAIDILMTSKAKDGQLLTYKIRDTTIVHCFDPPHLIKVIRNNLATKNLRHFVFRRWSSSEPTLKKELNQLAHVAMWDDVAYLYEINLKGSQKLLPKITDEHINPTKLKMKVSVAAQIFSQTYGKVMLHCTEKLKLPRHFVGTAQILLFVNDLFDSMNGSASSPVSNELKSSVTKDSIHLKFWEYAICMLSKMKFLTKGTGLVNNRSKVIQNCESTIRGYIELSRKCLNLGMIKVSIR